LARHEAGQERHLGAGRGAHRHRVAGPPRGGGGGGGRGGRPPPAPAGPPGGTPRGPEAARAAGLLAADGVASVVVDCESGLVRLGLAAQLAQVLRGPAVTLEELRADSVTALVRGARAARDGGAARGEHPAAAHRQRQRGAWAGQRIDSTRIDSTERVA
ncbi:hypothetical protein AAHZ94_32960, partial [Streptomyces sp. HSW2009]